MVLTHNLLNGCYRFKFDTRSFFPSSLLCCGFPPEDMLCIALCIISTCNNSKGFIFLTLNASFQLTVLYLPIEESLQSPAMRLGCSTQS